MPGQYCFVCATDEGVFLDVTAENKQIFHKQITDCSLSKAISTDELPAKICHKCAYELNQCSSFVQKYKKGNGSLKRTRNIHRSCCSLCLEPAKKSHIFNLSQDNNSLDSPINKLKDIFNYDVEECAEENILICLHCRYTLDLLFDLKRVCQQTTNRLKNIINKDADYLNFAKTKTSVVTRTTTITESTRIHLSTLSKTDSEENTMARGQSRVNKISNNKTAKTSKLRVCEKCNNFVKNDGDIYRLHSKGLSVCKSCWLTMDSSNHDSNKQKQKMSTQTKSCTVFLKDVLTDNAFKQQKVYRVEEDDHGNKVYIITDDSSECEDKLQKDSATVQVANNTDIGTLRQGQKRSARNVKSDNTNSVDRSNKKFKSDRKQPSTTLNEGTSQKQSSTKNTVNVPVTLPEEQLAEDALTQSSDLNPSDKTSRKSGRTSKTTHTSLSDADMEIKRSRVKLRNILHGIPVSRTDVSDESSSNEEGVSKRKKIKIMSISPVISEAEDSNKVQPNRAKPSKPSKRQRKTRVFAKKLSNISLATTVSQSTQSVDYDSDVYVVETEAYVCEVCRKTYQNKLTYLTHQLKHFKQPEIKLERVCPSNTGTESLGIIDLADDECEEQLENISITVDDDEEEIHEKNNAIIGDTDTTVKVCSIQKQITEELTEEQNSETENTRLKISQTQSGEMDEKEDSTVTELLQEELQCPVKESDADAAPSDTRSHRDSSKNSDEDSSIQDKDVFKTTGDEEVSKECNEENSTIEAEKDRTLGKDTESIQNTVEKVHGEEEITRKETKEGDETQQEDQGGEDENARKEKGNQAEILNEDETLQKENDSNDEHQKEENAQVEKKDEETREEDKQEEKQGEVNEENQEEEKAQVDKKDVEEMWEEDKQEERPQKAKRDDEITWEEDGEDKENQIQKEDIVKIQKEDEQVTIDVEDKRSDTCTTDSSKPPKNADRVILDNDKSEISKKEHNGIDEKEVESETEIRIVDTGSSEESNEQDLSDKSTKPIEVCDIDDNIESQTTTEKNKTSEKSKSPMNGGSIMKNDRVSDAKGDSAIAVTEVLQEVIDLATAEVQKRQGSADSNAKKDNYDEAETLENISREIYNTSDMSPFESSIAI